MAARSRARRTAPARRRPRLNGREWILSALAFASIAIATGALGELLDGVAWWFVVSAAVFIVLLVPAIVRSVTTRTWLPPISALGAGIGVLSLFFASDVAILGVIPTPGVLDRFAELGRLGQLSIQRQGIPADADPGILFFVVLGIIALTVLVEWTLHWAKWPAAIGMQLLVILLVPTFIDPALSTPLVFAGTAAVYLALILVASGTRVTRTAIGVGALAVVGALILPAALPAVNPGSTTNSGGGLVTTGVNPIINLGADLRRGQPVLALSYKTDAPGGVYLKLTNLDDFTGLEWQPSEPEGEPQFDLEQFPVAQGLADDVARSGATTFVEVAGIAGRWLPAPYPATSVVGLRGTWAFDPVSLTIRTNDSTMRGQDYRVTSSIIAPTAAQLEASGTAVEPGFERYLQVPQDLPGIVATTAIEVVGDAPTNYAKALALQAFFRDGSFIYSEEAPVEQGYDGSGAAVLAAFLDAKSGYCVHFASAMASMARTLGIPARIGVGFTPGEQQSVGEGDDEGTVTFDVTTNDLHAWPELYFEGVGWVQFEPTPGRGLDAAFENTPVDDPSTPDVDESIPTSTPTAAPTRAPVDLPDEEQVDAEVGGESAAPAVLPWPILVVLAIIGALLLPALVRSIVRSVRFARLATTARAMHGWDEILATARDLAIPIPASATPAEAAIVMAERLADPASLGRVLDAVQLEAFAERAHDLDVSDVRILVRQLSASSSPVTRLVAVFAPRSLIPVPAIDSSATVR